MRRKQRCVSEIKSKIDNNKVALVHLIEKETAIVKWELLAQHMIVDVAIVCQLIAQNLTLLNAVRALKSVPVPYRFVIHAITSRVVFEGIPRD